MTLAAFFLNFITYRIAEGFGSIFARVTDSIWGMTGGTTSSPVLFLSILYFIYLCWNCLTLTKVLKCYSAEEMNEHKSVLSTLRYDKTNYGRFKIILVISELCTGIVVFVFTNNRLYLLPLIASIILSVILMVKKKNVEVIQIFIILVTIGSAICELFSHAYFGNYGSWTLGMCIRNSLEETALFHGSRMPVTIGLGVSAGFILWSIYKIIMLWPRKKEDGI